MNYEIQQVKSEMHRTLLEVNFTDYKNASQEYRDLCEAIELCYARGDNADNLKVLKSKMMWRMKRIDAEYSDIIKSYHRWQAAEERKQSILRLKCDPKMQKAMTKFRMHYFEAMQFVKDNPHDEDTEDEMLDLHRQQIEEGMYYDQDTPPDYDYDYTCLEKPGDETHPSFGPKDSPPPCKPELEMPPSAAPPIQAGAPPSF